VAGLDAGRTARGAVIGDGEPNGAVVIPDVHHDVRGRGVFQHVRQRLLHDPVRRQIHARGQRSRLALDMQLGGQAGRARRPQKVVDVGQPRPGIERPVGRSAQHTEDPLQLGQRLPAGLLHNIERVPFLVLIRSQQPAHSAGVQGHDADAVRDDVVQLPGDFEPLLRHRRVRPLLRDLRAEIAHRERAADRPGQQDQHRRIEQVGRCPALVQQDGRPDQQDRHDDGHNRTPRVEGRRTDREKRGQNGGEGGVGIHAHQRFA
jgi:hypothetical protein